MNERRKFLTTTMALAAGAALRPAWAAAGYPERPIRLVVPYAPGGGSDVLARVVARGLTDRLGVSVVVENRGGAGGAMGLEAVVRSQPDGYTLVLLSTSHATNGAVMRLNYDVVKDTSAVGMIASGPWLLVAGKETGFTRLADLLRAAKRKPGSLNYASSGTGSSTHLATELFARRAGISVSHVPYRSTGLALTDLLAGRVQFMLASTASVTPMSAMGGWRPCAYQPRTAAACCPISRQRRRPAFQDSPRPCGMASRRQREPQTRWSACSTHACPRRCRRSRCGNSSPGKGWNPNPPRPRRSPGW